MTNMQTTTSHRAAFIYVNPCYQTKKVESFLGSLVFDYRYKSYSELSQSDKFEFAALLIDASKDQEFLIENRNLDEIATLLKNSLSHPLKSQEYLESIHEYITDYYEDVMEKLFNEKLDEKKEYDEDIAKYGDPDDLYDRYREGF